MEEEPSFVRHCSEHPGKTTREISDKIQCLFERLYLYQMRESRPQPLILPWRKNHLSFDIVLNILERLPVKSVIRFSHLNVNNKDSHDNANGYVIHMGSSRLLTDKSVRIRKFKTLPEPCLGHLKHVSLGFAYHSENNDYKVVRIHLLLGCQLSLCLRVEVYTLSSDSWRSVGIEFATNVMVNDYNFRLTIPLVSGALHWLAHIKEGEEKQDIDIIMAFDVNTEKFRKLAALPHVFIKTNPCDRYLTSFKGKLAFITFGSGEQSGSPCSIWVLKEYGVVESWIKLSVISFERVARCIAFTEYGSLLTWSSNDQVENQGNLFHLMLKLYIRRILISPIYNHLQLLLWRALFYLMKQT
ncbi:putative F-box protein At3g23260 [Quercus suber]|uniref:putative F-box protein At3g23260 n=1 Tax=Quercus suber TaxID=58331 RepID=UPI0032E03132